MERDGGAVARRTLLSGALGTVGLAVTGCSTPPAPVPPSRSRVRTVVLGKPKWMSIPDIRRLADAGMTIGSHTWDHHAVSKASGQSVEHFAYPYGVVSDKAYRHLSKAGYKTAFQLKAKRLDPSAPLYTLRRTLAVSTWSGPKLLQHLKRQHP